MGIDDFFFPSQTKEQFLFLYYNNAGLGLLDTLKC